MTSRLPAWYLEQARAYIAVVQCGRCSYQEMHAATRRQREAEGRLQQLWAGRVAPPPFTPLSHDDLRPERAAEATPVQPLEHSQLMQSQRVPPVHGEESDPQESVFGVRRHLPKRPPILHQIPHPPSILRRQL